MSDYSPEAIAAYPDGFRGWAPDGIIIPSLREGFDAGRASRDAVVAELRSNIIGVLALHQPGTVMPSTSKPGNQCTECSDPDSLGPVPWPCPTVLVAVLKDQARKVLGLPVEGAPRPVTVDRDKLRELADIVLRVAIYGGREGTVTTAEDRDSHDYIACINAADAIADSGILGRSEAVAKAEALREAADRVPDQAGIGPFQQWLRARAAELLAPTPERNAQ